MISSIFHWLIEEKNAFPSSSLLFGTRFIGNFSARPARGPRGENTEFPFVPLRGFASRVQFVEKTKTLLGDNA